MRTRPRYRVGDLVVCVDVGGRVGLLEAGKLYRVVEVRWGLYKLDGAGQSWFSGDHFRAEVA